MTPPPSREFLRALFDAAVASAQPERCIPPHLPPPGRGRTIVIGAGKAAAAMARAVETQFPGPLSGLVVTRTGHAVACERIEIVEAGHPVPDGAGLAAAERMLRLVQGLQADDLVLCLLSGGGSALLPLPAPGLTLAHKQALHRALLASGASIREMNCVRRHCSAIKGGRLAVACHPARVVTLAISDVPGDDPLDIASGPTVADPTTCGDALAVLRRHRVAVAPEIVAVLESGAGESVKPGDPRLAATEYRLIATPQTALDAAARAARAGGMPAHILGNAIEGEARELGTAMAGIALQVARHRQPFPPPCVLLSGGETTVTAPGPGRGGATSNSCLRSASRCGSTRASWRLRATRTASTARRRSPAPIWIRPAWRVPARSGACRATISRGMTHTHSSRRWAIRSSPGRPTRM